MHACTQCTSEECIFLLLLFPLPLPVSAQLCLQLPLRVPQARHALPDLTQPPVQELPAAGKGGKLREGGKEGEEIRKRREEQIFNKSCLAVTNYM